MPSTCLDLFIFFPDMHGQLLPVLNVSQAWVGFLLPPRSCSQNPFLGFGILKLQMHGVGGKEKEINSVFVLS